MQIEISSSEQDRLRQLASEAGFTSVEQFVTQYVRTLAQHPATATLTSLSEAELHESLNACDRGMTELESEEGQDAIAALQDIGRKRGYVS